MATITNRQIRFFVLFVHRDSLFLLCSSTLIPKVCFDMPVISCFHSFCPSNWSFIVCVCVWESLVHLRPTKRNIIKHNRVPIETATQDAKICYTFVSIASISPFYSRKCIAMTLVSKRKSEKNALVVYEGNAWQLFAFVQIGRILFILM